MGADVLPYTEDGRKSWAENMLLKFPPLAGGLGFNGAETTSFLNDITMLIYVISASQSAQLESKAWTAFKRQMLEGVPDGANSIPLPVSTAPELPEAITDAGLIPRIRGDIARMKTAKGFTEAIGEQLQIFGDSSDDLNLGDVQPKFKAVPKVGSVTLNWTKGDFDGVVIESQRGSETVFTFLDKDFKSPFDDLRPNLAAGTPEVRRYRMIYLLDDQVVGIWSDEVVITTKA